MNYGKTFLVYKNKPIDTKNILKKNTEKIDLKNEYLAFLDYYNKIINKILFYDNWLKQFIPTIANIK